MLEDVGGLVPENTAEAIQLLTEALPGALRGLDCIEGVAMALGGQGLANPVGDSIAGGLSDVADAQRDGFREIAESIRDGLHEIAEAMARETRS